MTANTVSKKKPIIHQTVRIERVQVMMNTGKSSTHWSEGISSELVPHANWELEITFYPCMRTGHTEKTRAYISVYLNLAGLMMHNKEDFYASFQLYLVDGSGRKINLEEHDCRKKRYFGGWVSYDQLKKALHADGSLVVAAEVWFPVPSDETQKRSNVKPYPELHSDKASMDHNSIEIAEKSALHTQWHDSINKLRETGAHSDCTLMVGGEQLKAHRNVLSAISPIFGRMFGNERFQEAKDGIVRIEDPSGLLKDSTANPYKALLSYAYTGCVDWTIFGECKGDVLVVACKYLVLDLKHHVERQLAREITAESIAELALLADTYSCDQLKKTCVKFLSSNCQTVVLTPQWGDLTESRGDLAKELLRLVRGNKATASTTIAADGGGTK